MKKGEKKRRRKKEEKGKYRNPQITRDHGERKGLPLCVF